MPELRSVLGRQRWSTGLLLADWCVGLVSPIFPRTSAAPDPSATRWSARPQRQAPRP